MNNQKKMQALETYFNLMSMNGGVFIFEIAQKMGIFQLFQETSLTSDEVTEALGFKKRPTKLLLDALQALNLLELDGDKFKPAPTLMFLKGNYQNLSADYWEHLPILLKTGVPYKKMDNVEYSENEYEAQVKALEWMMKPSAILATKLLGIGTQKKAYHILDVGAGSAVWSLTMLQEDATARAEAIDWPAVLKIAKTGANAAGLSDRFTTIEGNFLEIEMIEANYDLVVIANVTHILTAERNIALFKKVKKSLKKNGEIVIFDVFSGQEKGNLAAALYALGLGIRTEEGTVFKPEELIEFLKKAGYSEFKVTPLEVTPYTMGMLEAK